MFAAYTVVRALTVASVASLFDVVGCSAILLAGLLLLGLVSWVISCVCRLWRLPTVAVIVGIGTLLELVALAELRSALREKTFANGRAIGEAILRYEDRRGHAPDGLERLLGVELEQIPQPWLLGGSWSYHRLEDGHHRFSLWLMVMPRAGWVMYEDLEWHWIDGG